MSVISGSAFTLTLPDEAGLSADHPIIGWQNVVTPTTIVGAAAINYPASNMGNPATHLKWKAPTASAGYQFFQIITNTIDPIDYVAIARHNLGSVGSSIIVGYLDNSSPQNFLPLVAEQLLGDDGPALFRFTAQTLTNITIALGPSSVAPEIAVTFAGKLLVLPRKIYQGLAPINYARTAKVTNGRSEAGQFLGRIVLQEFVKNSIPLSLIGPTYFREHIADFLAYSKENPFFFAWRPQTYPDEIGYCHMTNDPLPVNEAPHGLIAMTMEMTGVI